ncbi:MAG: DUF1800 domain-containing protein [Bacteroidota bacterium]
MDTHIHHLLSRAGFGPSWTELFEKKPYKKVLQEVLSHSKTFAPIEMEDLPEGSGRKFMGMSTEEKVQMLQKNRKSVNSLNLLWMREMAHSPAQLREKMAFFWHDHFACKSKIAKAALLQVNTLREHAIGNFGELLHAIAKDPSMLLFLNNQQNKKTSPNENFAREVCELFTVGRGNYTEQDVKEAARAFTGWSTLPNGSFFFRKRQHDFGKKTFLGRRGNFSGEDIIEILLEEKATARNITRKLYHFLVSHEEDPVQIESWAKGFYESGYDISTLLKTLFESDHFRTSQHVGARIKSPIEYMVGILRLLDIDPTEEKGLLFLQKALGQTLFFPPNVAGWPEGKAWIDGSSLLTRLRFPIGLGSGTSFSFQSKAAFAGNEEFLSKMEKRKGLRIQVDWDGLFTQLEKIPAENRNDWLKERILLIHSPAKHARIAPLTRENFPQAMVQLMATLEYQLC